MNNMRESLKTLLLGQAALPVLMLAVFLSGCADPVRQTVGRPFIAAPVDAETIFGDATIGEGRSLEAIA
ncbi:MAG: hypothetical protein LBL95_04880, partial [Deltaproteobacteria bacterium]|nr:hypothetical protein [Deltaproteobacteria bacterium]